MSNQVWELALYSCEDGDCLMIHNVLKDSKLGALSLDHKSVGEAIVDELNSLENKVDGLTSKIKRSMYCNHMLHRDFDRLWEICKDTGWTEEELIRELEK